MRERLARATPTVLALFFAFATLMCAFAAATLLFPGTPLDGLWRVKPDEHRQLLALGPAVGAGFAVLAVAMMAAGIGAWRRRRWGWALAVAIFAVNGLGDASRIVSGAVVEGAIGVAAAAAVLWWLTRPQVRRMFER